MTTEESIRQYQRRPQEYFNIDGMGEVSIGIMLMGFTLIGWIQRTSPKDSFWNGPWGFLVSIMVLIAVIDRVPKLIKAKITHPRTGYVEYPRTVKFRAKPAVIAIIVSAAFAVAGLRLGVNLAALTGLVLVPVYAWRIAATAPWKWLTAVAIAAISVAVALGPEERWAWVAPESLPNRGVFGALAAVEFLIGVVLVISGAASFVLYLRNTHAPEA
jgi:hypothetical protein